MSTTPFYMGFDTETYLIVPGLLTPPLVCASGCSVVANGAWLLLRDHAVETFENLLDDPNCHLVIHNAPFDLAVMVVEKPDLLPKVFAALDAGRIHCTRIRDMMLHNAAVGLTDDNGPKIGFTLADVVKRRFEVDLSDTKNNPDAWRLRYHELDGKPLSEWPEEAKTYAKDDAVWHLRVFEHQEEEGDGYQLAAFKASGAPYAAYLDTPHPLADEAGQTRAAFALHLMAVYGVLTDEVSVQNLEADLTVVVNEANEKLKKSGILRGTSKKDKETGLTGIEWTKDTKKIKALVEEALGATTPKTKPSDPDPVTGAPGRFPEGQTKTDEETLRLTRHPDLLVLAGVGTDTTMLTKWVPALKGLVKNKNTKKVEQRGLRLSRGWLINPGWNPLVSTGRTSCYAPALQQMPRPDDKKPVLAKLRPCIVPRPGNWFLSVDYSFIEMVAWAQTCLDLLGVSDLAEAIRAGQDPHIRLAVEIMRAEGHEKMTHKEDDYKIALAGKKTWAKGVRQMAKSGNFSLMGGSGIETFIGIAYDQYGVELTDPQARSLKDIWKRTWSEAQPYFNHIQSLQQAAYGQPFTVVLPRTGFVRAGCTFTSGCNSYFQGLAARGLKEALWETARECYLTETSALYGCRPVMELHDEIILEVPAHREQAHAASLRLQEVMVAAMSKFVPDVPVKAEPALSRRWMKEAEPVYGADGVLDLWEPS
jgi:hypothetical protein